MKYFLIFFSIIFSGILIFIYFNWQPYSSSSNSIDFSIQKGESLVSIANNLENQQIIKDKYFFIIYAKLLGLGSKLHAGDFRLSPSMPVNEIVDILLKKGSSDYWLKILGGQKISEIKIKNFAIFPEKEGYLFPDNYLIPESYTLDQILNIIDENFQKKFKEAKSNGQNINLSDKEVVILASLIEREARTLESKRMIVGIFFNRLNIGMALELCSSAQYARDSRLPKPKDYWLPLSSSDTHIKSNYNTYTVAGLPPGPICSPGYDSLYAAFHPIESDYLYFITGTDNKMHYAKTLTEHNQNIAKYLK